MNKYSLPKDFDNFIKELESFFDLNLNFRPLILEVESRNEFDSLRGEITKPWLVAFVKGDMIIIFSKKSINKETTHKIEEWDSLVKHELCHIFYYNKFKTYLPLWLNEGLALNLANQKKPKIYFSVKDIINLTTKENFSKDKYAYHKSYWIVKKLLENEA